MPVADTEMPVADTEMPVADTEMPNPPSINVQGHGHCRYRQLRQDQHGAFSRQDTL